MNRDLERRRYERLPIVRPCKIFEPRSGKYYHAVTEDLSVCGALIHVNAVLEFVHGDLIYLGIALKRRQAVLLSGEMTPARILRRLHTSDARTVLAVELEQAVDTGELAAAA